jgi:DNA-binding beta-propeller fold protein YncE
VYVADGQNNTIRQLMPLGTNWLVCTIAGLAGASGSADGTNNVARFSRPIGLAVDSAGTVFVADEGNQTIRMITPVETNWASSAESMGKFFRLRQPS